VHEEDAGEPELASYCSSQANPSAQAQGRPSQYPSLSDEASNRTGPQTGTDPMPSMKTTETSCGDKHERNSANWFPCIG
jgi:hypothetical protein